jgi:ubiquinone/menaquinone biosynthesis C-methylase UbiE
MSTAEQVKEDYDKSAQSYNDASVLPAVLLESQLIKLAIGDATDLVVLDIGGGSGIHAREAVEAGARRVDIVDLSTEMLKVAEGIERSLDRKGRMRFFEANVAKPMDHLPLDAEYDIVMANWVFDHAGDVDTLKAMWANISKYLKPGGRFLGIRMADLFGPAASSDKYGISLKNVQPIPDGFAYTCLVHAAPAWEFDGKTVEMSYSGSLEMHENSGLTDIKVIPYEDTEAVKSDPGYWELWLQRPIFAVVRGTKRTVE